MNEKDTFMNQHLIGAYKSALNEIKDKTVKLEDKLNKILNELNDDVQSDIINEIDQDKKLKHRMDLLHTMLEAMENQLESFLINSVRNIEDKFYCNDIGNNISEIDVVESIEGEQEGIKEIDSNFVIRENGANQLEIKDACFEIDYSYLTKETQDITKLAELPRGVLRNYKIVAYIYNNRTRQVNNWSEFLINICRRFMHDYSIDFTKLMQNWTKSKEMKRVFRRVGDVSDSTRYVKLNNNWMVYNKLSAGDICKVLAQIKDDLKIVEIQCALKKRKGTVNKEIKTEVRFNNTVKDKNDNNVKLEEIKPSSQEDKDIFVNCSFISLKQGFSKNKKIVGFTLDNVSYQVNSYIEMLNKVCNIVINFNEDKFKQYILERENQGTLMKYFITRKEFLEDIKNVINYNSIGATNYYLYRHIPNTTIEKRLKQLLGFYEIEDSLFKIYYRE